MSESLSKISQFFMRHMGLIRPFFLFGLFLLGVLVCARCGK